MDKYPKTRPDEYRAMAQDPIEARMYIMRQIDIANMRLKDLEEWRTGVSVTIKDYRNKTQQIAGVRKALIGLVFVCGCVYGFVEFGLMLYDRFKG